MILGSVAIVDRARSVFMLSKDIKTGIRTLSIEKSNNISDDKIGKPTYFKFDSDTLTFCVVNQPNLINDKKLTHASVIASNGESRAKIKLRRKRDKELWSRAIALYKECKKQCEIAEELNVSTGTISRWIKGYKKSTFHNAIIYYI